MNPFLPILVALFLQPSSETTLNKKTGHFKYTPGINRRLPVITLDTLVLPKVHKDFVVVDMPYIIQDDFTAPCVSLTAKKIEGILMYEDNCEVINKPLGNTPGWVKRTMPPDNIVLPNRLFILDNYLYEGKLEDLSFNRIKEVILIHDPNFGQCHFLLVTSKHSKKTRKRAQRNSGVQTWKALPRNKKNNSLFLQFICQSRQCNKT